MILFVDCRTRYLYIVLGGDLCIVSISNSYHIFVCLIYPKYRLLACSCRIWTSPAFMRSRASHEDQLAPKKGKSGTKLWAEGVDKMCTVVYQTIVTAPPCVGCSIWSHSTDNMHTLQEHDFSQHCIIPCCKLSSLENGRSYMHLITLHGSQVVLKYHRGLKKLTFVVLNFIPFLRPTLPHHPE